LNGKPISKEHGGPGAHHHPETLRMKGAKSFANHLSRSRHQGFWEVRGYSNSADSLLEETFLHFDSRKLP